MMKQVIRFHRMMKIMLLPCNVWKNLRINHELHKLTNFTNRNFQKISEIRDKKIHLMNNYAIFILTLNPEEPIKLDNLN
jgi:hypothetical protein